ncbi:hypothetical protein TTHERM_00219230 (macronuclear) [Tetrahymena thermophila SB210]|uniref:Uncharacterized protein n=1 Tax=Tetrahymena thermophila (strain SB210) TaxID=312017 RepID=I7M8Z6_TETTS|nr:hypothetical protein TTHERM_00219230 [Tetrahymena thermophila SB210]EAS00350.1 hypothetical protein TTHERM_00219230 [Tetrahymena thermophila SB210]|eukprot:XP_001020595.1 hypothetical protein TTHERM_00219230 [Tetrahymena thermophila SB210]
MNNHSSAQSAISSHTKYSAKSQISNITNQNPASGQSAYGQKTKQQIAQEVELAEDDIMKRYMEQQEKHKQLMIQNQKRRKDQEKKLKEEMEKKKKQEEQELLKRKETKQQAYVKFLRSNATKVADNLKQNKSNTNENGNQVKKKASTANQQKRPAYIVVSNTDQNKTVTSDLSKPKRQWNTAKSNSQNTNNQDKNLSQNENRVPVPLEEYYADQKKQSQNNIENKAKEMNFDALDLNIPSGKDDFERIKKMYAKQNQVKGNDFIVNFEKEWNDDDDSLDNLKQSKLLESLDLSTVQKKKNKQIQDDQLQKKVKNIKSQFDNIQENDSFDENEYEQEKFEELVINKGETSKENKDINQDKSSRAQLQQKLKQGSKQTMNDQQHVKKVKEKEIIKQKQAINKNESALIREAIGFDDEDMQGGSDNDEDIGIALGFKDKVQNDKLQQKSTKQVKIEQTADIGLTEAKLQLHNEIMEGTISLENQKYDVLSWANNKQKEVEEVFSQVSGKVSNATSKLTKPVSAKLVKDDKKPPIVRSNTNNNLSQQNQQQIISQQRKQNEQDANSIVSEDKMQRQNIRQISANRNAQISKEKNNQQERQFSTDKQLSDQNQNNQKAQHDKSKDRKPQIVQPPPSKQKYQKNYQNKIAQNNQQDSNSEVASSNQGRVSKFKQKLQWNVQQSRRNKTKSPDSVGTRDEDINVEEFLRDDLININKEEMQLQQEIYELHFDNIDKIRDVESRHNVNLNLVSSKQVKELESNPSTIIKPIKPIYEYSEQELEQSLIRLDKALAKKTIQSQQQMPTQINPQIQNGYQQNFNDLKSQQQTYQNQQQLQNQIQNNQQQVKQLNQKLNGQNDLNQGNQQNLQINLNNNINNFQQQIAPNNMIAQQLQILQQQQQLLLQQIVATQQNQNNLELNPPPVLQNQVNSMKVQQILNANQLTYKNLAEQNESLNKIEQNFSSDSGKLEKYDKKDKAEANDQNMYISPQFGINNHAKKDSLLNNNIKNVTNNVSLTSQQQYQQSQYNYDINDLQSISQVNSIVPSNNAEQRRQKLKDELDEEVESKISEIKSKIQQNKDKEQPNSYKQKHIIKKEIKHKKVVGLKEEKQSQLKETQDDNTEGVIKFAGNDKLKALLLDNVEEEDSHNYNQDNSFD